MTPIGGHWARRIIWNVGNISRILSLALLTLTLRQHQRGEERGREEERKRGREEERKRGGEERGREERGERKAPAAE